jgi:aquaporin Z
MIAEFVGTFLLVFTVGCNVLSQNAMWAGVSIACVLMVAIFSFGATSGANFNPAVSFCLTIVTKRTNPDVKMTPAKCGVYSAIQIAAGIVAGLAYGSLFGDSFGLTPARGFGIWSAGVCELLYTFVLCFVVCNVAAVKKGCQSWFGLAIGFVIIAGAYGAGAVSGGCFNPAVALGIDISHRLVPKYSLIYVVFELVGAALAAVLFHVVRPNGGDARDTYSPASKLLAEFIGTYVLVLTVGLNVLGRSPAGAFSIAASLMCMIYALGDVSGGNFNPAVTLAIMIQKKSALVGDGPGSGWDVALKYMASQIAGAILAGVTYMSIHHGETFPLGAGPGFSMPQALSGELIFTSVLCLVVLRAAVNQNTKTADFFALAIGSCVTVGGFAIGALSGGSLNPAVSFGIAFSQLFGGGGAGGLLNAVFYSLVEFLGAACAASIVMFTHPDDKLSLP